MKIPLMAGRDFDWRDRENTPLVAVVNDTFAKRFFNGSNPVGQSFRIGCSNDGAVGQSAQIVGVVGDTKYFSIRELPTPTIYTPFRQSGVRWMTFAVRTTQDPTALLPSIRGVLEGIDATVPLYEVGTQAEFIARGVSYERTLAIQLVMFGGIALLLSCSGIYGTLAYLVNQRTSEIGIRMAVGARAYDIVLLVLRESFLPVALGVAGGVFAALALTRLVVSMLFGVQPADPMTFIAAALLLDVTAVLAALLPARRASRIDPMLALRAE